ncbi:MULTISPECIES: DUF4870 domain-containing protein [Flavobacterium]|uniref:DUF4870 domain-containing protein n=1 Tax=Flavobacterium TaxID=237 RepID=UPI00086DDBC6|nr:MULTISPECIES: DUF4870 domain-containing protein [Flavobacterium]MBN9285654.1 DUF4870 domain-containing protein [Flavobacterium sp.]ODS83715.1 MAG: hypothetical protein ABS44_17095 [Chryseobacterium sp. SCN 40-13]OJV70547.1 MAG: hypothetical protein BGO42_08180 [Flavobacterium sp. 40-81]
MTTTNEKNTATILHLSTLTQYFIPFGNYFFPILIWALKKDKSDFVDYNGKQTLNFQLSMLLYSLVLLLIAVPILIYVVFKNVSFSSFENGDFIMDHISTGNITGIVIIAVAAAILFGVLKVVEFFLVIYAAVKSSNGQRYHYPLAINFLK